MSDYFDYEGMKRQMLAESRNASAVPAPPSHDSEIDALERAVVEAAVNCIAENRGVLGTHDYSEGYLKIEGPEADAVALLYRAVGALIAQQEKMEK